MGRRGQEVLRRFWGGSAALAEGVQIVQWGYTCRKSPRRESQSYEWEHFKGATVRAVKSSEFGEGKL